jgi:hypothetical protein
MLLEGPQQIKRGEQVGLRLALHNTWEERIEVSLTLTWYIYLIDTFLQN